MTDSRPLKATKETAGYTVTGIVPRHQHELLGQTVWVRAQGVGEAEQVVIVHVGDDGPSEVARHYRATPGTPKIADEHFPTQPEGPLERGPRARNAAEAEFLDLGEGARLWLIEAAAAGTTKMRVKMGDALALAKLFDAPQVGWALGHAPPADAARGTRCRLSAVKRVLLLAVSDRIIDRDPDTREVLQLDRHDVAGIVFVDTPMLWAAGFLITFLFGGLTGIIVAMAPLDFQVSHHLFRGRALPLRPVWHRRVRYVRWLLLLRMP